MTFEDVLHHTIEILQRRGRVSYGALQRQFGLDPAYLADLKVELIDVLEVAADKDGTMLVWTGSNPAANMTSPPAETPAVVHSSSVVPAPTERQTPVGERRQKIIFDSKGDTMSEAFPPELKKILWRWAVIFGVTNIAALGGIYWAAIDVASDVASTAAEQQVKAKSREIEGMIEGQKIYLAKVIQDTADTQGKVSVINDKVEVLRGGLKEQEREFFKLSEQSRVLGEQYETLEETKPALVAQQVKHLNNLIKTDDGQTLVNLSIEIESLKNFKSENAQIGPRLTTLESRIATNEKKLFKVRHLPDGIAVQGIWRWDKKTQALFYRHARGLERYPNSSDGEKPDLTEGHEYYVVYINTTQ